MGRKLELLTRKNMGRRLALPLKRFFEMRGLQEEDVSFLDFELSDRLRSFLWSKESVPYVLSFNTVTDKFKVKSICESFSKEQAPSLYVLDHDTELFGIVRVQKPFSLLDLAIYDGDGLIAISAKLDKLLYVDFYIEDDMQVFEIMVVDFGSKLREIFPELAGLAPS